MPDAPGGREQQLAEFLRAVQRGDVAAVRAALDGNPSLRDAPGPHPFWGGRPNALQVAAEWGRLDVLRLLLDAGASPDAQGDYDGWAPLHVALAKGRREAALLLLARRATLDAFAACLLDDEAALARVLRENASRANARGPNGATPLHFAATPGLVRALLAAGADPDARDRRGNSPGRTLATRAAHHEAARMLLGQTGERDLWLAAALDDLTAAAQLMDADPAARDRRTTLDDCLGFYSGGTPLHVAADSGSERVAALLLERGADASARSLIGHTPLHAAAAAGQEDVAALLLMRGADLSARDAKHQATPLDWARFQQRDDMVAWLRERGAS
jgi:ankyrin repeat protein